MIHTGNTLMKRTIFALLASITACVSLHLAASQETITLGGNFGSFIELGATLEEVNALGPDRVEAAASEDERIRSNWYYFSSRGIRVRVCADNERVETVNASVTSITRKYATEAGVRIGDNLSTTKAAYGERLEVMPETENTIWFVHDDSTDHRITFGFGPSGGMRWVALGALRENGWTCGQGSG